MEIVLNIMFYVLQKENVLKFLCGMRVRGKKYKQTTKNLKDQFPPKHPKFYHLPSHLANRK